jgi:hypothetical protein
MLVHLKLASVSLNRQGQSRTNSVSWALDSLIIRFFIEIVHCFLQLGCEHL